ncbi:hypothetical protein [Umezakia ovalisporum]|jgi:hypothetical protein|uniref:Uncharacterized protein n=2 Tax=Umezakia ovalisporum TaxID=75695 RepID=A0AA43KDA3_9CYAN|nr:hypothetical protein [Umezakia ovalisporum]MBI1240838.1 hypothetical protein [Nostoc sp. RI_552]MDH6055236.1 hypothetical protein [Umezakia ovalisporum FSS-43]MDH6062261.1 hypothetical protein [Umezakia ovalisporum FSS-62]MDH6068587.1 hypothetical protein [Umezakia ovalisporum APH033B]MDH6069827.1 hypothetical protein [Umezakia ovalisporum CobakiLakeA]
MTPDEIETALQAAFNICHAASCPLTDMQKQILLRVIKQIQGDSNSKISDVANPLDELSSDELAIFLQFVKIKGEQNRTWKVELLNDWLHENDSGNVQFIRQHYGLPWLNRVEPYHFNKYSHIDDALKLRVGDRIEICNGLWEWVQDDGPCKREWFPCIVLQIDEIDDCHSLPSNCLVRLYNGSEYEIQGIYQWNRYNWRWPQK